GLWAQPRLLETGGGQRAPEDSVTFLCHGTGFAFAGFTIRWYLQTPDGTIQWVSYISSYSSSTEFGQSVKGRARVFRDDSKSESSLSLWALQPRDSGRYFCAIAR
ncbi:HV03 protein, partial [Bucco capensis]|nr:HV03 protein [Bucco capensis]NXH19600.1 HV03 protein [Bucco capensis]